MRIQSGNRKPGIRTYHEPDGTGGRRQGTQSRHHYRATSRRIAAKSVACTEFPPELREQLSVLSESAVQLEQIVADFQTLLSSRQSVFRHLDLNQVIESILHLMRREAETREIELNAVLHDQPLMINAEINLLKIALFHLIRNALEATPRRGKVRITTMREGEKIVLIVHDSGQGIPQDAVFKNIRAVLTAPRTRVSAWDSRSSSRLFLNIWEIFTSKAKLEQEAPSALPSDPLEGTITPNRAAVLIVFRGNQCPQLRAQSIIRNSARGIKSDLPMIGNPVCVLHRQRPDQVVECAEITVKNADPLRQHRLNQLSIINKVRASENNGAESIQIDRGKFFPG